MGHRDVWKCFLLVTTCKEGAPEGDWTSVHTQAPSVPAPKASGTVAKHPAMDSSEKALWTFPQSDMKSLSAGCSPRSVLWQQMCAPGLLRTAFHGCRRHAGFLTWPLVLASFYPQIQERCDEYWHILHLDHPGFCSLCGTGDRTQCLHELDKHSTIEFYRYLLPF